MKKSGEQTLFVISTDASRTGTPVLLLKTLQWIKNNSSFNIIILLQSGGELLDAFNKLGQVYLWEDVIYSSKQNKNWRFLLIRILKKLKLINDKILSNLFIRSIQRQNNIVLTLCNSARNGYILYNFRDVLKSRILLYVHEGEKLLNDFNKNGFVDYTLNVADSIISVSGFVRESLINSFGVKKNIELIPGCVHTNLKSSVSGAEIKASLDMEQDSLVIMCSGWLDWHKGVDFFIQLALKYSKTESNVYFVWVGGSTKNSTYHNLIFDISKIGISQNVRIIPNIENPIDYFNIADIFLVLSREESFSLVTIEAGLLKKPVLCFYKSGGPCEIVDFDNRFIVPYADVDALYNRTIDLLKNENERKKMGEFLYNKVINSYDISIVGQKLLNQINTEIVNSL